MIPEGWQSSRIGELASVRSGSTPLRLRHERYFLNGIHPWVKTLDLNNGEVYETHEKITDLALQESSCSLFPPGTILVAMYGGFNQIGRTGILRVESSINQAISALLVDRTVCYPEYLLNWLNGNVDRWRRFAASSRKDPNITRSDVEAFPVLLPPLPEQRKIAAILSTWDEAITLTERLIEALRQRKQALMQLLLTGEVRFKEFEGEEWSEIEIGSFLKESRISGGDGVTARKITVRLYGNGVFPKDDSRSGSENTRYFVRKAGQFIYSKLDFLNGAFGIIPDNLDGYESTLDLPTFDINPSTNAHYFLNYVSREDFYRDFFGQAKGGRKARRVAPSELLETNIQMPLLPEQNKISEVISLMQEYIDVCIQYLDSLVGQKRGLMQQLLTGAIRVQVDE